MRVGECILFLPLFFTYVAQAQRFHKKTMYSPPALPAAIASTQASQADSKAQMSTLLQMISWQYKIRPNRPRVKEMSKNSLKEIRESLMISKVELARKTELSPKTITRIEQGLPCRMETKPKIIRKLGSIIVTSQ